MPSLANLHLQSNTKINSNGGNLSSDAGLLLLNEFIDKLGLNALLKSCFKTTDQAKHQHLDDEILLQKTCHGNIDQVYCFGNNAPVYKQLKYLK